MFFINCFFTMSNFEPSLSKDMCLTFLAVSPENLFIFLVHMGSHLTAFVQNLIHHDLVFVEYCWTYMRADAEGLDEIRRLSEAGKMKIPVEKTFPITQVREAHEAKEKRLVPGKVVLEVD